MRLPFAPQPFFAVIAGWGRIEKQLPFDARLGSALVILGSKCRCFQFFFLILDELEKLIAGMDTELLVQMLCV